MGIKVTADVCQSVMLELFTDLEDIIVYIDEIIIIGASNVEEHVSTVNKLLRLLKKKGMQVNPLKSLWGQAEGEYLEFIVTREGVHP